MVLACIIEPRSLLPIETDFAGYELKRVQSRQLYSRTMVQRKVRYHGNLVFARAFFNGIYIYEARLFL
jgi:hypothetical protein